MPQHDNADAAQEWAILQPLYERYEGSALTIKLLSVTLFSAGLVLEYLRSASRPTVAFPYGLLLLVAVAQTMA